MLSDSCHFAYKGNPQLPRHRSRVPASAFSTVLVRTPCNFLGHESEPSATTRCRRITIGGELQSQLKRVKHIYTYYLLVITQLSFEYLHAVTRQLFLEYIANSHAFAGFWQAKLCYVDQYWMTDTLGWCTTLQLYLAGTYDVSRHLAVTTHHWMHTRCIILQLHNSVEQNRTNFELTLLKRQLLELWIGVQTARDFSCTQISSHLNVGHIAIYNNGEFARVTFGGTPDVTSQILNIF